MANSLGNATWSDAGKTMAKAYKKIVKDTTKEAKKYMSKCKKCDMNEQILESSEADLKYANIVIDELKAEIAKQNEYTDSLHTQIAEYRSEIAKLQAGSDICQISTDNKRYELTMKILNQDYVDSLVIALARQGYAPYISMDKDVCFEIQGEDLQELRG